MQIVSLCLANLVVLLLMTVSAYAQTEDSSQGNVPGGVGVVDQFVSFDERPKNVFVLQEVRTGSLQQYPATIHVGASGQGDRGALVGAAVLADDMSSAKEKLHYSFFSITNDGTFIGTAVRHTNKKLLFQETKSIATMKKRIGEIREKRDRELRNVKKFEKEVEELRVKASKIAGVGEIVDLKMELAQLQGFGDEFEREQQRLQGLIEIGRSLPDPPDVHAQRSELDQHLREAAKATAMTDRLNARKKNAAVSNLKQQLALIKETESYNAEALAQEVLKLRRKRRELEGRLNIGARDNEDF